MISGKKILLGVTGSIAAYKAALLVRLLVKEGAEVKIVMTEAAKAFITPLTLATLSKHPVYSEYFNPSTGEWHSHVELGLWPDLMVVVPVSAHSLSAFAHGQCENLLQAVYLSARCPVWLAPAMDLDMYVHPAVHKNLETLRNFGHKILDAEVGELASGLSGQGRMAEPETIVTAIKDHFTGQKNGLFAQKRILITSGPTREAIDPVRFISNHSTGKMGSALAMAFAEQGAVVDFVTGPVNSLPQHAGIRVHSVNTAEEMASVCFALFQDCQIAVLAAAVADYKPNDTKLHKLKKEADTLLLSLVPTQDIALALGQRKRNDQIVVGFALETNDEEKNAMIKLRKKNFDMIVLNSLNDVGAGFGHDTNKVTILKANGERKEVGLSSKQHIATIIRSELAALMQH
jgi:phosphopantothenoylcysteine decarboxylase/phosphopantothenate--cysteine ligase